ncbi:MAG: membrane dipeptidase, partial [Candidatus Eremiobacterota bacterium]
ILLSLEGAGPLGGSLERLEVLYHFGFRAVGLTHNHNNLAAGGCAPPSGPTRGISPFGRALVARMERLGMAVDTAHLSRRAFSQLVDIAEKPLINSHTCCARFVPLERNLTDSQLKDIAASGGLAAVTYVPRFLTGQNRATSRDVFRHLEHMVEVMGVEHVGLGSDFDGVPSLPADLTSPADVRRLVESMVRAGWSERDISRVLGGNWHRVLKHLLPRA